MSSDRYTIISADTHAGGSHQQYREYLDAEWRDEFDAWRGQYKNPWKDLRDTDLRALARLESATRLLNFLFDRQGRPL